MIGHKVTHATPSDRPRVIETVAAAFVADAAFRFLFPDDACYSANVAAFAGYLFDRRVAQRTVWVVNGGSSVALWDRPVTATAVHAVDPPALALPADTMARLDAYGEIVHGRMPGPHWYLSVLATHPDHVGRRWGRAVMAAGLDEAAKAGLPAYLETSNPDNLALYRRAGWQLAERVSVHDLTVWIMVYPPPATGSVQPR